MAVKKRAISQETPSMFLLVRISYTGKDVSFFISAWPLYWVEVPTHTCSCPSQALLTMYHAPSLHPSFPDENEAQSSQWKKTTLSAVTVKCPPWRRLHKGTWWLEDNCYKTSTNRGYKKKDSRILWVASTQPISFLLPRVCPATAARETSTLVMWLGFLTLLEINTHFARPCCHC